MSKRSLNAKDFTFTRSIGLEHKDQIPEAANRVDVGRIEGEGGSYTINGRTYTETLYVQRYRIGADQWSLTVSPYSYGILTDSAREQLKALAESVEADYFYAPTSEEITADYQRDARANASRAIWELNKAMTQTFGYTIDNDHTRAAWSQAKESMQELMDKWQDGQAPKR